MNVKVGVSLIALIIANPTYATIDCGSPIQDFGPIGKDHVTSSFVSREPNGKWNIIHNLSNGKSVRRETQYNILNVVNLFSWSGYLANNPAMYMTGVTSFEDGQWYYAETLFRGYTIVMHSKSSCISDPRYPASTANSIITPGQGAPTITPEINPVIASIGAQNSEAAQARGVEPFDTTSTQFSVAIIPIGDHGGKAVDVILGVNMKLTMVIDTGADIVAVTDSIAKQLFTNDEATEMGKVITTLADGSTRTERMISINKLTIGDHHTVYNIPATVSPDQGTPLLGVDVLNQFGRFSIDTAKSKLILG